MKLVSICLFWVLILEGYLFGTQEKIKVVVLGFDGIETTLFEKWMQDGYLPNMKKLINIGTYRHLCTTNPAESPVAWASFSTSTNPGKTKIFDFLSREPGSYQPQLALARVESQPLMSVVSWLAIGIGTSTATFFLTFILLFVIYKRRKKLWFLLSTVLTVLFTGTVIYTFHCFLPSNIPVPVANKDGTSFWTIAANRGVPTVVLRAPISFPAEKVPGGKLLCGLGVPDIRGTNGLWSYYTTEVFFEKETEMGGWVIPLSDKASDMFLTYINGPKNLLVGESIKKIEQKLPLVKEKQEYIYKNELGKLKENEYLKSSLIVKVDRDKKSLSFTIGNKSTWVKEGDWSEWLSVDYSMSPILSIRGMIRIKVIEANKAIRFYMTPVQFHPLAIPKTVSISYPYDFCSDLVQEIGGLYGTLGWESSTNPTNDEIIPDEVLLEEIDDILSTNKKMLFKHLSRKDWRLFVKIFYFTDRVSHMFWRYLDRKDSNPILESYRKMDEIVGEVMQMIDSDTMLFVLSDHGFAPFHWNFNLNTWLYNRGYLVLNKSQHTQKKIADLYSQELLNFDWPKTKAYSIGLGKIYINLKGRDPQGIVLPGEEYEKLRNELIAHLEEYHHENRRVVHKVYRREDIYSGKHVSEAADLVLGFCKGYRISWQSTLGGVPDKEIEENVKKWSGDHCSVDPSLIPGILVSNRVIKVSNPSILDIAPTILRVFGIPTFPEMEGRCLLGEE